MTQLLATLAKKQEEKIFRFKQHIFLSKKVKCPRCSVKITVSDISRNQRICVFCTNCRLVFEKINLV